MGIRQQVEDFSGFDDTEWKDIFLANLSNYVLDLFKTYGG